MQANWLTRHIRLYRRLCQTIFVILHLIGFALLWYVGAVSREIVVHVFVLTVLPVTLLLQWVLHDYSLHFIKRYYHIVWRMERLKLMFALSSGFILALDTPLLGAIALLVILVVSGFAPESSLDRKIGNISPKGFLRPTLVTLTIALLWAVAGAIIWSSAKPTAYSGLVALGAGILGGLTPGGGLELIKLYVLRALLRFHDSVPHNYARFLDYAVSLSLLRKVGPGYIFIHRYILEYFADRSSPQKS